MNALLKIKELHEKSLDTEINKLKVLYQPNADSNRVLLSLSSVNISKFENCFFNKKDLIKSKQYLYTSIKCDEYRFKYFKKSNPIIQRAFYLLLSDSKELIESFKNWEFNNHDYWLKHGAKVIIIQEILKNNYDKALQLLTAFNASNKEYPLKETDSAILKAIINKDKKEVEELLEFFLLPKNHTKINDKLMLSTKLFSLYATGYAKLAWLKGIEVNIEHPLLPTELLPIKPNKEYFIEYDFLKPDFKPKESTENQHKKHGFFNRIFKKN